MAQTLLIGLGGTGSRVVNYVARDLRENNFAINDGNLCCAVLDTDRGDVGKINASGTNIPVIPTSKARKIRDYLAMYPDAQAWFPCAEEGMDYTMLQGAGQMRFRSRLAFKDIIADRSILQLENYINALFNNRNLNSAVRVMVVSSLAGGTGSGMFIQVALWLRKFFENKCPITIRGIFLLPDIFIRNVENIRTQPYEQNSLYANTYGAIRDLNAITRIRKFNEKPSFPVVVDDLFDSRQDMPRTPVYDYVFFVDDVAAGGSVLNSIDDYEQVVARIVYMQLYAPMANTQESKEDNLFRLFTDLHEPVYGSCGTAKASYPMKDVVTYCALRAAQDSLSSGWQRLDIEIKREQERERDREARGEVLAQKIEPSARYVELFNQKRERDAKKAGSDKLFLHIAHDVDEEEITVLDSQTRDVSYFDKVDRFIERIETQIAQAVADTKKGVSPDGVKLNEPWAQKYANAAATGAPVASGKEKLPQQSQLVQLVKTKRLAVENFLLDVDSKAQTVAYDLLAQICPVDMGDVSAANDDSIYGMFTKRNENGERVFVHPIAMRYMLYKLTAALRNMRNTELSTLRTAAQNGYGYGVAKIDFDNTRTPGANHQEETPEEYLASRAFLQGEESFIRTFVEKYAPHMAGQYTLCTKYAKEKILQELLPTLLQYLSTLTKQVESFFSSLTLVANTLTDYVNKNRVKNEKPEQKTIYVCASAKEKEAMYLSLELDASTNSSEINRVIAQTVYGQFCAVESPMSEANQKYMDSSLAITFYNQIRTHYQELILNDNDYRDKVDLDIYTALCRSVDFATAAAEQGQKKSAATTLAVDEDGNAVAASTAQLSYDQAFADLKDKLQSLGAPMLYSRSVQKINNDSTTTYATVSDELNNVTVQLPVKKTMSFWGYNPSLRAAYSNVNTILGINGTDGEDIHYAKGDLYYYVAEYGILPKYIPKLAEPLDSERASSDPNEGLYYKHYRTKVKGMLQKLSNPVLENETALLDTPHLDKTWHAFLPYISGEKQKEEDAKFLRLFWLAVAYGMITIKRNIELNNREYFYIARTVENAIRSYSEPQLARFRGEPIVATNVYALVESLRTDAAFQNDAAALEEKFSSERQALVNYEDTKLLRGEADGVGGLASTSEMNAVTMIVRYANATQSTAAAVNELAGSMENLLKDLISAKYAEGRTKSVDSVMFELCRRIHQAAPMKKDDLPCFAEWLRAWKTV